MCVLVNGLPGSGKTTVSRAVAETWFGPTGYRRVHDGLADAGIGVTSVVEAWCDCRVAVARSRFMARLGDARRNPRHNESGRDDLWWADLDEAKPLGFPLLLRVRTDGASPPDREALTHRVRQLLDE